MDAATSVVIAVVAVSLGSLALAFRGDKQDNKPGSEHCGDFCNKTATDQDLMGQPGNGDSTDRDLALAVEVMQQGGKDDEWDTDCGGILKIKG